MLLIALGYWGGAAVFWLPLALMLRRYNSARRMDGVLAGLVLSTIWPVSLPIVGAVFAARHALHRPVDATESALVGI